jgi:hypothetical protein
MAVIEKLEESSIDDLLTELRARESQKKGDATGGTVTAGRQPVNDPLKESDTATIVTTLKEKQKVIYGVDDWQDLYQITDQANLADVDSVVALFHSGNVTDKGNGTSVLQVQNFGTAMNSCSSEPFRH